MIEHNFYSVGIHMRWRMGEYSLVCDTECFFSGENLKKYLIKNKKNLEFSRGFSTIV